MKSRPTECKDAHGYGSPGFHRCMDDQTQIPEVTLQDPGELDLPEAEEPDLGDFELTPPSTGSDDPYISPETAARTVEPPCVGAECSEREILDSEPVEPPPPPEIPDPTRLFDFDSGDVSGEVKLDPDPRNPGVRVEGEYP